MALYKANRDRVDTEIVFNLTSPPPGTYQRYEVECVKLEERIAAMRALPKDQQPKNLFEGLLMLDVPVTKNPTRSTNRE
jgi:hypothetical protein